MSASDTGRENLIVFYVFVPDGIEGDDGFRVRDLLNMFDAIDWWFLNTGSFAVFFPANDAGRAQCSKLMAQLDALKGEVKSLSNLRTGVAEGEVLVSRRAGGGLEYLPLGETVNQAMRRAHGN